MQIFFTSELKLGLKRFHINYFTDFVVPDDNYPNDHWTYVTKDELESCIRKVVEIIDIRGLISIWESRFCKKQSKTNNTVEPG
jgi:hypothetical protein